MLITVDRVILEELFKHAASAAHLVGHLDDGVPEAVRGPLGDHVDAIAHNVSELLGDVGLVVPYAPAVELDDGVARSTVPMLAAGARGGR